MKTISVSVRSYSMKSLMICKPYKDREPLDKCFEDKSPCEPTCMYMQKCDDCGSYLDINTHILIMTKSWSFFKEEKTICGDCFGDYTPDNHNGWYDDEGKLEEEIKENSM